MRKYFLLVFLISILISPIKAQNDCSTFDWNWKHFWHWHLDKPFLELTYGFNELKHNNLNYDVAKNGLWEIKLGYSNVDSLFTNIVDLRENFFFASKMANSLQSEKVKNNEYLTKLWRFGLGKRTGYGYEFSSIRILPYIQETAVWTKLDKVDYSYFSPGTNLVNDIEIFNRYEGSIRFGTISEAGIRIEAHSHISLNAAYETSVIFPRYKFGKHIISFAIESAAQHVLDNFIDEVLDSSPYAGPIVNFVLKNGLSYAFYTLKKEKMNWPFNTETPLTSETLKFGITFTF